MNFIKYIFCCLFLVLSGVAQAQLHIGFQVENGTVSGDRPGPWTRFENPAIQNIWINGQRGYVLTSSEMESANRFINEAVDQGRIDNEIKKDIDKLINYFSSENSDRESIKDFIPFDQRPSPIPAGVDHQKVSEAIDSLWDAVNDQDILAASDRLEEARSNLRKLPKADEAYGQGELDRLFTYPNGQLKNLPFIKTEPVTFSGTTKSEGVKPFVEAVNAQEVVQSHLAKKLDNQSHPSNGSRLREARQNLKSRVVVDALKTEEFKQHYFNAKSDFPSTVKEHYRQKADNLNGTDTLDEAFESELENDELLNEASRIVKDGPLAGRSGSNARSADEGLYEAAAKLSYCIQNNESCSTPDNFPNATPEAQKLYSQLKDLGQTKDRSNNIADPKQREISRGLIDYGHKQVLSDGEETDFYVDLAKDVTDIGLGLIPVVGTAKDVVELFGGKNLITGEELTTLDRSILALSVSVDLATVGIGGRITKSLLVKGSGELAKIIHSPAARKFSQGLTRHWTEFKDFSESVFKGATAQGITSEIAFKAYSRIHKAMDSLPSHVVKRFREGTDPSKVAIIGRGMSGDGGVLDIADSIRSHRVKIETFDWSTLAKNEMRDLSNDWTRKLSYNEIIETIAFKENRSWAEKLVENGYTIFDVGDTRAIRTAEQSAFYDIESLTIWGRIFE